MTNIPEYSVSELSYLIKRKLEEDFSFVQVRGEISDLKLWNGHFLFNLKDEEGLLTARIWKNKVPYLNFKPEEGLEITATGKISTHQKRSGYNLIIDNINALGEGQLLKLIEARKKKLRELGLFNKSYPLPMLPNRIGVVTSLTGVVIEDIKNKISLKFPSHLLIWPINVQGVSAESDIINAIKGFNLVQNTKKPDVIILARGGGSIEDLMPFNSEKVAYEIYKSKIPIISAIGHETDFTIADFVADHRASTPTAAADLVVPEKKDIELKVSNYHKNLNMNINRLISYNKSQAKQITLRIINPRKLIENNILNLENILLQFFKTIKFKISEKKNILNLLSLKTPWFIVKTEEKNLIKYNIDINNKIFKILLQKKHNLKGKIDILNSSSYEKWLKKGFAIVKDREDSVIKDVRNLSIKEKVSIRFFNGVVNAEVKKIKKY